MAWLAIGVWLAGGQALLAQQADTKAQITVLEEAAGGGDRELLRAAVNYDSELRRLVGRRPASVPLYLVPNSTRREFERNLLIYGLGKPDQNPVAMQYELVRGLVYRLAIEINRATGQTSPEELPNWLIAALHWRIMNSAMPTATRLRFPVLRIQVEQEQLVPWTRLVDQAPGPEEPVIYLLHADACACLYWILERLNPRLLVALLGRHDPERSPSAALANAFPDQLGTEQAQRWFAEQVERVVHHLNEPDTYDQIRTKVETIERITIMVPTEQGGYGVRTVLLEEVPNYLEKYDYERANIELLIKELVIIMQDCPIVLRESLAMYAGALNALRSGNRTEFTVQIKAARERFGRDLEQGKLIQAYLAETEWRLDPPAKRLFRYLSVLAPELPLTAYQGQVAQYLNQLEERSEQPGGTGAAEEKGEAE